MTGTHRHEHSTHGQETQPETVKVVNPSGEKEPVESDPIKEAAKDHPHPAPVREVGSVDGKVPHGMTGNVVGDH